MEIVTSWMQRGIEQGLQTGRQEGRKEEAQSLILRLLARRVGSVPPLLKERIRQLSLEQIEQLGEALLDFSNLADLEASI